MSSYWKQKPVDLIEKNEGVFSRRHLDCGQAREFCHRIRLTDDRPFRLPYRRLSPTHYLKLKQTLHEMEKKEIIQRVRVTAGSGLEEIWRAENLHRF